jgi:methylmalonyl-CoA mutase C-terminal domain/subunit
MIGQTGDVSDRVLVAKVGLDGHDRGVKVVARILRDAGFEVIYTGLFQTPRQLPRRASTRTSTRSAVDAERRAHDARPRSSSSRVRARGVDIPVVVGGIIPDRDVPRLLEQGVAAVLTPGASSDDVVRVVRDAIAASRD